MKIRFLFLLFASSCSFLSAQTFNWAFGVGGSDYDTVEDIDGDDDGHFAVVGRFGGSMDVDPGAGVLQLDAIGNSDIYVAAFGDDGNLMWAVSMGGSQADHATNVVWKDNVIIVAGSFRGIVDFDPGPGNATQTSAGDEDVFLLCLTEGGDFAWVKTFGGTGEDHPDGLEMDITNNIVMSGLYTGTVDFDPGPGISNQTPTGSQDAFIARFDGDGLLQWVHGFGTAPGEFCYDLDVDDSGNVYACGLFYGTLDFDPGAGVFNLSAGFSYAQSFALKWTSDGVFVWAGMFGGSLSDSSYDIEWDQNGYMLITGYFNGPGDFDPGPGTVNLDTESSLFFADLFVLKLTDSGEYTWVAGVGVNGSLQTAYAMDVDAAGNAYITGLYDGVVDFDPGVSVSTLTNYGSGDAFILNLAADGTYLWAGNVGGTQGEFGATIDYTNGSLLTGGNFSWYNVDLDPTENVSLFEAVSYSNDGFVISNTISNCQPDYSYTAILLCPGQSYFINGEEQTTSGLYTEVFTNLAGCDSTIEVLLYHMEDDWTPFPDTAVCNGGSIELVCGFIDPESILWNTGEYGESIIVDEGGVYWFTNNFGSCNLTDTIVVIMGSAPEITFEFPSMQCSGASSVTAVAFGDAPFVYQWNDALNQTTATANGLGSGNYIVNVTDVNGCEASASVDILVETGCIGDFDMDGTITVTDMMMFVGAYGCQNNCCPFDLTQDGLVSVSDLVLFISSFGQICP